MERKLFPLGGIILITVFLVGGCGWFEKGLWNIVDPEAKVRMYYSFQEPPDIGGPDKFELLQGITFDLIVYPLNEVGFTIEELRYTYSTEEGGIAGLTKRLFFAYYVPPNSFLEPTIPNPGQAGPYVISNPPLFFQDTIDYLWKNYGTKNLFLTLRAFLRDDGGHSMEKTIVANFPILQFGEDLWPPANVTITPNEITVPAGTTLTFVAQAEDEYRIQSYQWFVSGGGTGSCPLAPSCGGNVPTPASTSVPIFTYTFTTEGVYTVVVKACDAAGNCSYGVATVRVTE
ncbi:MAG: PKD domain-containing protein [Candidatus Caldatribacteriaceae bacterium]